MISSFNNFPRSRVIALVPIIFTEKVDAGIRLLLSKRREAGVSVDNTYIFTSGNSRNRLGGWDTLQSFSKKVNLKKPKLITPTRTRKCLSTIFELLDMSESELTWVTNHFGHTKDIHRNWYKKEDATIELTKTAKVLLAVDSDESRNMQSKRIDDLLKEVLGKSK